MGGLCSGPKDSEAVTIDEVLNNTCSTKACDGWIERQSVEETEWQYVGPGKGGFDQVRSFDYVGEGRGSYYKDTKTTYHGWRLGSYGTLCTVLAATIAFTLLLVKLVFLPGFAGTSSGSQDSSQSKVADSSQSKVDVRFPHGHEGLRHAPAMADRRNGRGPPALAEPYNCSSFYFNTPWTKSKALWCCAERGVGCTTSPLPGRPGNFQLVAEVPKAPRRDVLAGTRPAATGRDDAVSVRDDLSLITFDCNSDYGHWRTGWSSKKKEWCCEHRGKACDFDCREDRSAHGTPGLGKRASCCRQGAQWCCWDPSPREWRCSFDDAQSHGRSALRGS